MIHTTYTSSLRDVPHGWRETANSRTGMMRICALARSIDADTVLDHIDKYGLESRELARACREIIDRDDITGHYAHRSGAVAISPDKRIMKRRKGYQITICVEGQQLYLGQYTTLLDAQDIRDAAELYMDRNGAKRMIALYNRRPSRHQRAYWSAVLGVPLSG